MYTFNKFDLWFEDGDKMINSYKKLAKEQRNVYKVITVDNVTTIKIYKDEDTVCILEKRKEHYLYTLYTPRVKVEVEDRVQQIINMIPCAVSPSSFKVREVSTKVSWDDEFDDDQSSKLYHIMIGLGMVSPAEEFNTQLAPRKTGETVRDWQVRAKAEKRVQLFRAFDKTRRTKLTFFRCPQAIKCISPEISVRDVDDDLIENIIFSTSVPVDYDLYLLKEKFGIYCNESDSTIKFTDVTITDTSPLVARNAMGRVYVCFSCKKEAVDTMNLYKKYVVDGNAIVPLND